MKGLYLLLDGLTLFFPLILSFDSRVNFVSKWKSVLYATIIIAVPFLIWDVIFTENGFWGFNPDYLVGIDIVNLPIEEVLFFVVVPFACTFIYECVKYYFRRFNFQWLNRFVFFSIPVYGLVLTLLEPTGWYTLSVIISSGIVLFFWVKDPSYRFIGIAFLISMIPFLIVNGVLTGGVTEEPIVWYSEQEKVTPRIWTIPVEDVLYCFTLIVSVFLLTEFFEKRRVA